jgi:hypothetical protein
VPSWCSAKQAECLFSIFLLFETNKVSVAASAAAAAAAAAAACLCSPRYRAFV